MTRRALFAVPLLSARAECDMAALAAAIIAQREVQPGEARTNIGGWDSDKRLFDWGDDAARALAAQLTGMAAAATDDGGARHEWLLEGWANISEAGDARAAHFHPGAYWSAVLFVAADGEGGELLLHDPRMPAAAMHAPALRIAGGGPEGEARIKPEPGMIAMFPAWLTHSVAPWRGPGRRITVAVNLAARLKS